MKTFALGDCHGNFKALIQCLERSKFNYNKDRLIVLGDVCDGWPYVKECFDELLKIKDLIYILGNHDQWALEWFDREYPDNLYIKPDHLWTSQGGEATLQSYIVGNDYDGNVVSKMPQSHLGLLLSAELYYIQNNQLFVHGGIDEFMDVAVTSSDYLTWDRSMFERAENVHNYNPEFKIQQYDTIFIGHTSTQAYVRNKTKSRLTAEEVAEIGTKPMFVCNVINLDTGAGWNGKLTIMDTKTKEYWQSDFAKQLYPEAKGRW